MNYPVVKDGVLHLADGSKMRRHLQTIDVWPAGAEHYVSYYLDGPGFNANEKRLLTPVWQMLDSVLQSFGL